eukprot:Lithocolla_globosa_v1_NODE_2986_length_1804_cov_12.332190.p2 type:complete len:131 gc:universal NODE_2986_length_1804_cov_12.332190:1398-1790(+)
MADQFFSSNMIMKQQKIDLWDFGTFPSLFRGMCCSKRATSSWVTTWSSSSNSFFQNSTKSRAVGSSISCFKCNNKSSKKDLASSSSNAPLRSMSYLAKRSFNFFSSSFSDFPILCFGFEASPKMLTQLNT